MKGRTYYQVSSSPAQVEPIAKNRVPLRPWKEDPNTPIYYLWRTSIPRNWSSISVRPTYRIKGKDKRTRDTMEFLKETQRYIDFIRKPIVGDEEILGISKEISHKRLRSASPMPQGTPRPKTMGPSPSSQEPLHFPANLAITLSRHPSQPSSPARMSPTATESKEKVRRLLSLPLCVLDRAGKSDLPSREPFPIRSNFEPKLLVAKSRTGHRPPHRRVHSLQIEKFMSRFEQKQEPDLATVSTKAMPGWKLTTSGSKTTRTPTPPICQIVVRKSTAPRRIATRAETPWTLSANRDKDSSQTVRG